MFLVILLGFLIAVGKIVPLLIAATVVGPVSMDRSGGDAEKVHRWAQSLIDDYSGTVARSSAVRT